MHICIYTYIYSLTWSKNIVCIFMYIHWCIYNVFLFRLYMSQECAFWFIYYEGFPLRKMGVGHLVVVVNTIIYVNIQLLYFKRKEIDLKTMTCLLVYLRFIICTTNLLSFVSSSYKKYYIFSYLIIAFSTWRLT